jgi:hypothetical protein
MVGAVLEREGTRPSRTGQSCAGPIAVRVDVSATRCKHEMVHVTPLLRHQPLPPAAPALDAQQPELGLLQL